MALYGSAKAPAVPATADGSVVGKVTDSTGGTASTTLAAITAGSSYAQADMTAVKNGLATLAALYNDLIDHLNDGRS